MELKLALEKLLNQQDLTHPEMKWVMQQMMTGAATDAQIGAILAALRAKGETIDEITAAVEVMRSLAAAVDVKDKTHLVDTCGTGGDGANTFNISTASAFVVSAAGATVAKHGNRSISSKSGSADVLEAAGVDLSITPEQVAECVNQLNIGFMFAPAHHSAMKHVIRARKEMGVRTIFNMLGPLTNPAGAPAQVIGVFNKALAPVFAEVLKNLGSQHVMIVAAEDGLDEISVASKTFVAELKDGQVTQWQIDPSEYDMDHADLSDLSVESAQESLNIIRAAFANADGAARDIICLNAGASIYVAGITDSYAAGVELARTVIAKGAAMAKLDAFIDKTQSFTHQS
ncbi:anthranilate phosphoribosyltransferase [Thiosulfatimonas sediminis]|uniref:Anthranilate phosphoribosyltransferase n=1 Tax=Thiosulfatimonas sediminis TaxID=2675054 RepID=A0A6F8PSD5_9GAMM|nr:anthranilate phosphoribosyltransferase [Thiosulfatimonas sediminis]BBP44947.1 anthranilate phosphoribosyltransferase [Thiosulfatimonas sediminis]